MSNPTKLKPQKKESHKETVARIAAENSAHFEQLEANNEVEKQAGIFVCPRCKNQCSVASELIGNKVKCPQCSKTFSAVWHEKEKTETKKKNSAAQNLFAIAVVILFLVGSVWILGRVYNFTAPLVKSSFSGASHFFSSLNTGNTIANKNQTPPPQPQQQREAKPTASNKLTGIDPATGRSMPAEQIVDANGQPRLVDPQTGLPLEPVASAKPETTTGNLEYTDFYNANVLFNQHNYTKALKAYASFVKSYPSSSRIPIVEQKMADIQNIISSENAAKTADIQRKTNGENAANIEKNKYERIYQNVIKSLPRKESPYPDVFVKGSGSDKLSAFKNAYDSLPPDVQRTEGRIHAVEFDIDGLNCKITFW